MAENVSNGEARMLEIEKWARQHEVTCMERYTKILETNKSMQKDVGELRGWLHTRMDWLLAIVCLLAITRVFTPEQVIDLFKRFFS